MASFLSWQREQEYKVLTCGTAGSEKPRSCWLQEPQSRPSAETPSKHRPQCAASRPGLRHAREIGPEPLSSLLAGEVQQNVHAKQETEESGKKTKNVTAAKKPGSA